MTSHAGAPLPLERLGFNALYVDTNVLTGSNWPDPSVQLRNVFALASRWSVKVFFPEPVRRETEEHWVRNVRKKTQAMESAVSDFNRITRAVAGRATIAVEELTRLVARFRENDEKLRDYFHIEQIPYPKRPMAELFEVGTRYEPPFVAEQEGKGFQDAVIFSSILEHLQAHQDLTAVLMTSDSAFAKIRSTMFAPACPDAKLEIQSLDEVFSVLYDAYWEEDIKRPWDAERDEAKRAIEADMPRLRDFITANLPNRKDVFTTVAFERLLDLRGIEDVTVSYAQTPIPTPGALDRTVRLAVAVIVQCRALVEKTYPSVVGLITGNYSVQLPPQQVETKLTWIGGVEVSANVRSGRFEDIKYESLVTAEELGKGKWYRAAAARNDTEHQP